MLTVEFSGKSKFEILLKKIYLYLVCDIPQIKLSVKNNNVDMLKERLIKILR